MNKIIDSLKIEFYKEKMKTEEVWKKGAECSAQNKTLRETIR